VEVVHGRVDPEAISNAVKDNTCLVTCILANNETGVIQVMPSQ
jgi:cysteine sulfinate desulfinase/cysteine desulfurase-like protein